MQLAATLRRAIISIDSTQSLESCVRELLSTGTRIISNSDLFQKHQGIQAQPFGCIGCCCRGWAHNATSVCACAERDAKLVYACNEACNMGNGSCTPALSRTSVNRFRIHS